MSLYQCFQITSIKTFLYKKEASVLLDARAVLILNICSNFYSFLCQLLNYFSDILISKYRVVRLSPKFSCSDFLGFFSFLFSTESWRVEVGERFSFHYKKYICHCIATFHIKGRDSWRESLLWTHVKAMFQTPPLTAIKWEGCMDLLSRLTFCFLLNKVMIKSCALHF